MEIQSLEELQKFVHDFTAKLEPRSDVATVITLSGDLGAGKTTFTQMFARELGVTDTITSPTFVIMKRYVTRDDRFKNLIHIDAYRLAGGQDLKALGWNEWIADPKNVVVVEWPEKVADLITEDAIKIKITWVSEMNRLLTIS